MKKLWIFGRPGSGKSITAERLSKILNIPCFHLDCYNYDGWNRITVNDFVKRTSFISNLDSYILDGNNYMWYPENLPDIDTIIFLDIESDTCIQNCINRYNNNNIIGMPDYWTAEKQPYDRFMHFLNCIKKWAVPTKFKNAIKEKTNLKIYKFYNYKDLDNFIQELDNANN